MEYTWFVFRVFAFEELNVLNVVTDITSELLFFISVFVKKSRIPMFETANIPSKLRWNIDIYITFFSKKAKRPL